MCAVRCCFTLPLPLEILCAREREIFQQQQKFVGKMETEKKIWHGFVNFFASHKHMHTVAHSLTHTIVFNFSFQRCTVDGRPLKRIAVFVLQDYTIVYCLGVFSPTLSIVDNESSGTSCSRETRRARMTVASYEKK